LLQEALALFQADLPVQSGFSAILCKLKPSEASKINFVRKARRCSVFPEPTHIISALDLFLAQVNPDSCNHNQRLE